MATRLLPTTGEHQAAIHGAQRIAFDAVALTSRPSGAGRVLKGLLVSLCEVDPQRTYVALVTAAGAEVIAAAAPSVELAVVTPGRGLAWELRGLGQAARRADAAAVFTIREIVGYGGPPVVMHLFEPPVYRLTARRTRTRADVKHLAKDALLHRSLGGSVRRAAAVTAGSPTTAAWLERHYGVRAPVILPGLEPDFLAPPPPGPAAEAGDPYFFHLSTGDGRENTELVLRGFALAACPGVRLLVAGGLSGAARERVEAVIGELGIAGRVELLGWVPDDRLQGLYRGTLAFLHPSKFEGYIGCPPLEAMALGTAVVALAAPGVTLEAGDAALLIAGEEPALLAAALERIHRQPAVRADLVAKGRRLVEPLSWAASARSLAAVFDTVLGEAVARPVPVGR